MKAYIRLLRPKHYIKNLLIFAPVVFSRRLFVMDSIQTLVLGFISICSIASAIYALNDICDVEKDRQHPVKRLRPIASGEIPIHNAYICFFILLIVPIIINILLFSYQGLAVIALYFLINVLYSLGHAKDVPILDIVILVTGFMLRVLYGSIITGVTISGWLYLTVLVCSGYLVFGKRRNEFAQGSANPNATRKVLTHYTFSFLDKGMSLSSGLIIVFYSLWAMSTQNDYLIWTVPLIIIILMKYSLDTENDFAGGDPVEVLYNDPVLLGMALFYAIILFLILYWS